MVFAYLLNVYLKPWFLAHENKNIIYSQMRFQLYQAHIVTVIGRDVTTPKYFMSANHLVLFVSTPNNHQIYKTTNSLMFHIVKIIENDNYVK